MKKWMAIPALAGAIVLGGVAMVANADKGTSKSVDLLKVEEVETKAVETVGGQVTEIEYEKSEDKYEVEVKSGGVEYELDINATTGEVISKKIDKDKMKTKTNTANAKYITANEAIAIALKTAQGTVTELELDDDDSRVHWEVEIEDGTYEYEFEIDAITGEILDFEKERDDD